MPLSTQGGHHLPDGIFGAETDQVVKRYQRDNGLRADGAAGRLTFKQLEASLIIDHDLRAKQMRADVFISVPIG